MLTRVPRLIKKMYPSRLWEVEEKRKALYLTFDDGPIPEVTPWVLQQLKQHNAKATFFCIGDNVRKNPETFSQIVSEGHSIGNHTFNHLNGWKTPVDDYITNSLEAENLITQLAGRRDQKLFRPPYGRISGKQARLLELNGYKIVMWDVLTRDYNRNLSAETCFRNVIRHTRAGSIIVFHDSLKAEKNLKVLLPAMLQHFSKKGYTFGKL